MSTSMKVSLSVLVTSALGSHYSSRSRSCIRWVLCSCQKQGLVHRITLAASHSVVAVHVHTDLGVVHLVTRHLVHWLPTLRLNGPVFTPGGRGFTFLDHNLMDRRTKERHGILRQACAILRAHGAFPRQTHPSQWVYASGCRAMGHGACVREDEDVSLTEVSAVALFLWLRPRMSRSQEGRRIWDDSGVSISHPPWGMAGHLDTLKGSQRPPPGRLPAGGAAAWELWTATAGGDGRAE